MKALNYLQATSIRSILVATFLLLMAPTVLAQISAGTKPILSIEFKAGAKTAVVKGTVSSSKTVGPDRTSEGSEQYSLRAQAGQTLTMKISSDNHQAVFTLVKPSPAMSKIEFVKNAARVTRWSGPLTISGDYQVIVFPSDRESFSRFKLRITLR